MDRRHFISTALASLAYCNCPLRASPNPSGGGCSLTAAQLTKAEPQIVEPTATGGLANFENEILANIVTLRGRYGLRPGATFIEDKGALNAYAVPDVLVASGDWGGTDGTLLLGINLFLQQSLEVAKDVQIFGRYKHVLDEHALNNTLILAHEFGHILQFKYGIIPGTAWQMEPHADFMAGWAIDKDWVNTFFGDKEKSFENAVRLTFSLGDTLFNDPRHHGEPQFRAAMVQAGQDAHDLPMHAAFEKGKKLVGLI